MCEVSVDCLLDIVPRGFQWQRHHQQSLPLNLGAYGPRDGNSEEYRCCVKTGNFKVYGPYHLLAVIPTSQFLLSEE